ncbi:MAG TPA: cation transporter, partial [Paludibacter sp.]|nr:cation transporter [Paludibacter sp.]
YKNIKQSLRIILQGIPEEIDMTDVSEELTKIPEIESVHDLHIWSVDGNYNVLTVHVVLNQLSDINKTADLKLKIREMLEEKGIQHATIEFETKDESCSLEKCC